VVSVIREVEILFLREETAFVGVVSGEFEYLRSVCLGFEYKS
jgi:hypothetical protein